MATQNRTTKPQPTQGSAAARQAAQAPAADAAKMAKQAADKAELDKMAQAKQAEAVKEVVAETAAEGSVATADAAAAAEGSLGAVSGEAAVAEAGAAGAAGTAAAISPLAIGAGVVGVVAVAAAAGGGSSGGSSSQPIAQNNTQQAAQNQGSQKPATPAAEQPAQDTKPAEATQPAQDAKPAEPAKEEPAKQAEQKPAEQPKVDPTPVEDLSKPATAGGTAEEVKVAADGVTNLTKFADLFETAGANGGKAEFIKITRVYATESTKIADARVIDYDHNHAYEVIDAGKPITLAEAQAMATKLGGKLLSIDTAEEKAWLDQNLIGRLGHQNEGNNSAAAWMSSKVDANANALIRTGSTAKDFSVSAIDAKETPLSHFVIEYENYQSPLLLNGKPVVDGTIINKADAGKLAWNADQSKVGEVTYQAVDSDDADTAKPVAGAEEHSMGVTESADVKHPMTTPANPGAQDKPAQGGTVGKPANDVPQADQNGQDNQNSDHQPAKPELPATAQGTPEAPQVATTGETQLTNVASAFEKAAGDGKNVLFIKIVNVDTSEGEAGTRIYREVETTSKATGKAPDAPAPAKTTSITAYEVIDAGKPISRTEAEEMAKARGGKLLSIDSADEAKFIGQNLFGKLGEYDGEKEVNAKAEGSEKNALQAQLNKQLADNGAWLGKDATQGAVANADAIIRNGNGKDQPAGYKAYDFSGEKLSRFVIEIENYKAPLTLHGKPVENNQIIHKSEFDKLVWNGDHNMGGKITYVAVQSSDINAANVEGAEEKTLTVTESAAVTHPTAPAPETDENPQQGSQTDGNNQGGSDAGGSKAGGSDAGDSKAGGSDAGGSKAGGSDAGGSKAGGSDAGDSKAGGSKAGGSDAGGSKAGGSDAGGSKAGGSDAGGSKAGGSDAGGSKAGGSDADDSKAGGSDAGGSKAGGSDAGGSKAGGSDAGDSKAGGSDAGGSKAGGSDAGGPKAGGSDAGGSKAGGSDAGGSKAGGSDAKTGGTTQDGGSKSPSETTPPSKPAGTPESQPAGTPAQGGGQPGNPSEGSSHGNEQQPAQPKLPTYPDSQKVDVATHDAPSTAVKADLFLGTGETKATAVKITEVPEGALKKGADAVRANDVIQAADFGKLTWDATKAEGGAIKFKPVTAEGNEIAEAKVQTITVTEPPAPVVNAEPKLGVYAPEKSVVNVGRDADPVKLDSKLFAGTDPEKTPDAVKITVVHGPDNQPTNDGVLTYTVGGQKHSLTSGSFLDKANFDKVEWDAKADTHNAGTYKVQFKPVTADHQEIASATEHNFDVKEASGVPTYESSKMTFNVDTHDGKQFVPEALFKGENADTAPLYVWIKGSTEKDGGSDGHVFMRLADGSNGGQGKDLTTNGATSGEVISWSDLGKVQWDATHNNGGTIRFQPLDGDKQPIGQAQEIDVTESPATPQGSSETQNLNPAAIFNPQGAGAQLKSLAYTQAEPSSNLLDDLHNQINPLI